MWSHAQSFCATLLISPDAMLDKIVFTLTNPVEDGLVHDYRKWPGFNTRPSNWRGGKRTARRPSVYFKNTPETIEYTISAPARMCETVEQAIGTTELHIRNAQEHFATQRAAQGRSVVGVRGALAQDPYSEARKAFKSGATAIFPGGTFPMRRRFGATPK